MTVSDELTLGERVAEYRRRRGLSQRELAAEVHRSESWVSQVERDVQPVERLSVLHALAEALGVTVRDLRPETARDGTTAGEAPPANDLDGLRLAMSGHAVLGGLLDRPIATETVDVEDLARRVDHVWSLTHESRFAQLSKALTDLLPRLETGVRDVGVVQEDIYRLHDLRARAYQAAAAAFARQDDADAAWVAADRAIAAAEASGNDLDVVAGHFRMAHAFIRLRRFEQAEHVSATAISALRPLVETENCPVEAVSLYGAMHLVQATIAAHEGDRATARKRIRDAEKIAKQLGEERNDFDTEFGPTNVQLHAVAVAVELADAGEALEIAEAVDPSELSPERQARLLVDIARAHTQRRHVGEATTALLRAEQVAPEQVRAHHLARETIRDLMQLAGRRASDELTHLARRAAATP
jgi:transcriptional regulator with XRE-family HTH domain